MAAFNLVALVVASLLIAVLAIGLLAVLMWPQNRSLGRGARLRRADIRREPDHTLGEKH